MLPATGFVDGATAPHARRAVEIEVEAAARPPGVFQYEVPIEQDCFHFREERIVAVNVGPARLHHSNFGIDEVMDGAQKKIFRRYEVGIENSDELAFGCFQSFGQRPSFEALTINAMVVRNRIPQRGVAFHKSARRPHSFVGGIVQHLNIRFLSWVIQPAHGVQQAIHHILLVENWKLNRNPRQIGKICWRISGAILFVLVVEVEESVAVHTVRRQQHEHHEIGDQQRQVESVGVVEALKSSVKEVLAGVLPDAAWCGQSDHGCKVRNWRAVHKLARPRQHKRIILPDLRCSRLLAAKRL